ncbi:MULTISPECIES: DUF1918 domain-containing protein [Streptomyces]|uniref:DUF1918 domain-containing protein n=1 Tax=Streptomyces TaxID=1883 RepID=UPI00099C4A3A
MQASVGGRIVVHGWIAGQNDLTAEAIEVLGDSGSPRYLVRFEDGHETLMSPAPGHRRPAPHRRRIATDPLPPLTGGGHTGEAMDCRMVVTYLLLQAGSRCVAP